MQKDSTERTTLVAARPGAARADLLAALRKKTTAAFQRFDRVIKQAPQLDEYTMGPEGGEPIYMGPAPRPEEDPEAWSARQIGEAGRERLITIICVLMAVLTVAGSIALMAHSKGKGGTIGAGIALLVLAAFCGIAGKCSWSEAAKRYKGVDALQMQRGTLIKARQTAGRLSLMTSYQSAARTAAATGADKEGPSSRAPGPGQV